MGKERGNEKGKGRRKDKEKQNEVEEPEDMEISPPTELQNLGYVLNDRGIPGNMTS